MRHEVAIVELGVYTTGVQLFREGWALACDIMVPAVLAALGQGFASIPVC